MVQSCRHAAGAPRLVLLRRLLAASFGILAAATAAHAGRVSGPAVSADEVLASLHGQDVLVEGVGFRLATANADLCPSGWSPGFSVHTLEQYGPDYRGAAARTFGLKERVGVMSVVAGSPAGAAGLGRGDDLIRIDGADLPAAGRPGAVADFTRTGVAQQLIARAFRDGVATLIVMRAGRPVELDLHAARACPSIFQVVPGGAMNGEADGLYVQVSSDLVALAQSDDELAALLAHELAHNMLGHRRRLDNLGVNRGLLAPFGRNARLIRETEAEADRLSIYLVARAGYVPEAAISFWDRVRRAAPTPFGDPTHLGDPTHPRWSQRLRSMQREQDRIKAADPSAGKVGLPLDLERNLRRPLPPQAD